MTGEPGGIGARAATGSRTDPPPVPWTTAYQERRERTLRSVVHDRDLIARFRSGEPLPAGYGVGLDERCVEMPWLVAQMPSGGARLLDAGSSLNHDLLLDVPVIAEKRLHIVTQAPEPVCFWERGISYLYEDLRALPLDDGTYDCVASISTLEHVGCDNTFYTGSVPSREQRLDDFVLAARELGRVLKPGGVLLLTVPYGAYRFHGSFQQFDRRRLSMAEAAFGPMASVTETFFRYTRDGWRRAADDDCADAEYVAWVSALMRTGQWPAEPQHEPDYAAAARAVACVRMIKPS